MSARRFLVPAPSGALAFDTVIFSRSHDLFASSRSCYSSFDFTHVVYRLHRVAALKIMYFRGGVGRTFFLRSPRVSFRRLPPSLRRFSFLSCSSLSHPVLLPPPGEPRCNNGCPLIIGRPRHFKKIPRAHHGIPFRSLLKISLPLPLPSFLTLSRLLFLRGVRDAGNKNNQRGDRCSWKISFVSREHLPRIRNSCWSFVGPLDVRFIGRERNDGNNPKIRILKQLI